MTPEEIAEKIVHDYHSARRIPFDLRSAIATALREAEARGLERAIEIARKAWPKAHTYASENADTYIAQDRAVDRVIAAIRAEKERQP